MVGRVMTAACGAAALALLAASTAAPTSAEAPAATNDAEAEFEERGRKVEILAGARWRRAMFELNEWLAVQPVYTSEQVRHIKANLADRVAAMSSYELEYMLDTLEFKLRILDSPAAIDAREWLGSYLSVMADSRRSALLADVPNVVSMTSGELLESLERLDEKRAEVERRAADTLRGRREFATFHDTVRSDEREQRVRSSRVRRAAVSFSPYRAPAVGDPPFTGAYGSPTIIGVVPYGTFVGASVGAF